MADRQVLTTGQVARLLRCAPRTAGKMIDSGLLKGWRMTTSRNRAGDRRVTRAALEAFAAEHGIPLAELDDPDPDDPTDPQGGPPVAEAALALFDEAA